MGLEWFNVLMNIINNFTISNKLQFFTQEIAKQKRRTYSLDSSLFSIFLINQSTNLLKAVASQHLVFLILELILIQMPSSDNVAAFH